MFVAGEQRRHSATSVRELEPVVAVAGAIGIHSCATPRGLPQMDGDQPGAHVGKHGRDRFLKTRSDVFNRWRNSTERLVIFVEKLVIELFVYNAAGAFFDFADVDQHTGLGIDLARKYKIGNIVASAAMPSAAFRAKRDQVLAR